MSNPSAIAQVPTALGVRFWTVSDVGRVRKQNEDACLVDDSLRLFMVADGMGGHASGEVASRLSVATVRDAVARQQQMLQSFQQNSDSVSRRDILRLLESAVQQACSTVHQEGLQDSQKRGMGTTLDVLLLVGTRGFIAHVGDSRVYLYRQGLVHQLTEDHSLINELTKRGRLSREEIDRIQHKNAVTRAVGVYESVEVDVFDFDVLSGDHFLLCSDGLYNHLAEGELADLFAANAADQLARRLVELANERGGNDNITAVVANVTDLGHGAATLADEVNLKIEVLQKMALFRYLGYQDLVRILGITEVRSYQDGNIVVREGEDGEALFLVLEGGVRVYVGDQTVSQLGSGQHFGEMALIDRSPRSASVASVGSTKLLVMKRQHFIELVRSEHAIAVKLLWNFVGALSNRLRGTLRELQQTREQLAPDELSDELLGITDVDDASSVISLSELEAPTASGGS